MLQSFSQLVILVRHGEAKSTEEDPARPLSVAGKQHAERMATWLDSLGTRVEEVRHSGKARAEQTAQIIGHRLGIGGSRIRQVNGLAPNDDPTPVAEDIAAGQRSIMLVGHLPFMARLASSLLTGSPGGLNLRFTDAGCAVIVRAGGGWQLVALLSHEMV